MYTGLCGHIAKKMSTLQRRANIANMSVIYLCSIINLVGTEETFFHDFLENLRLFLENIKHISPVLHT